MGDAAVILDLEAQDFEQRVPAVIAQVAEPTPSVLSLPAKSANDPVNKKEEAQPWYLKGWSLKIPLTSFHYGGGEKSRNRDHNDKNFGLAFEKILFDFKNSNLSLSFGAYQNSYHNISTDQTPEPNASTISPFVFLGYKYKFSEKIQCGFEGGLVQYYGNMKKMQVNTIFNATNIDASIAILPTCDFEIKKGFGVSAGYFPGDELSSGAVSSVGAFKLFYKF